jgi:ribosomal protein S14
MKRKHFLKYEFQKQILKSIKINKNIAYSYRYHAYFTLINKPRISRQNLAVKRCVISGRVWGVNEQTSYTRFVFRNEIYKSNLPGFRRASW